MELDVCIKGRRSVRDYTEEAVSKEQIEAVLEAGTWAPTGMNRQPWWFIVIEDRKLIRYVSDETKILIQQMMPSMAPTRFQSEEESVCYNAPVLILVCTEKDKELAAAARANLFPFAGELAVH